MRLRRLFVAFAMITCYLTGSSVPANAAQPPKGYPTQKIMYTVKDKTGYSYPVRLGFFDSSKNVGFGKDKAYYKHNIKNASSVRYVVGAPTVEVYKKQYTYFAYANKYVCTDRGCEVVDSRRVRAVMERASMAKKHNWPVNGRLGLMTIYCDNPDKAWKCPSWADAALTKAYSKSTKSASVASKASSREEPLEGTFYGGSYEPLAVGSKIKTSKVADAQ